MKFESKFLLFQAETLIIHSFKLFPKKSSKKVAENYFRRSARIQFVELDSVKYFFFIEFFEFWYLEEAVLIGHQSIISLFTESSLSTHSIVSISPEIDRKSRQN